jgi:glycerol-3-phosphate acyltransferase PlsY
MSPRQQPAPAIVIGSAYFLGAIPFSNIVARVTRGVDLRHVGTGTVSGSGLFYEAGFKPLLVGGVLDVAKGAVGPLLAGSDRPHLAAAAASAGVVGHNWSIFLNGAGGRGISPSLGAMTVIGWQGSLILLGGLALGRTVRLTSIGALASYFALVPAMKAVHGRRGAIAAAAVVAPMLLKRITGNHPIDDRPFKTTMIRLIFDQDTPRSLSWDGRKPGLD